MQAIGHSLRRGIRQERRQVSMLIHDVTARDGIQNEKRILNLEEKLQLVQRVIENGPASVEVCSFVRGDLVPAMAGSKELCQALEQEEWFHTAKHKGMRFAGLVPNMKGYESFRETSLDTVVCLVSCTESHSKANVRMPLAKALETTLKIVDQAKQDGRGVRAYASLAFECPFEGTVEPQVVVDIVQQYVNAGADTVVLADTLGQAMPEQVRKVLERVLTIVPADKIGLHMHDAHGRAQENVAEGLKHGVMQVDCSIGGAGGCNFVPDAKGNISTQSVVALADAMKIHHGLDKVKLDKSAAFLQDLLQRPLDNQYKLTTPV